MKIGFVLDDSLDKTDGVQQYVLTLGKWYSEHSHEVHFLVGETLRTDIPHVHSLSKNVQAHFNQNRMSIPLPAKRDRLKKLLEKEKFDVLHVQMPYSPWLAGRIIDLAPEETAVMGTFHIIPYSKFEALSCWMLGKYLWKNKRRIDGTVSVSSAAKKFAKRGFGMRSEIIPNTVNLAHFRSGKRLRKYNDSKVNIVFLGRLVPRKGCMNFLQAIEKLHSKGQTDTVRVVICGKGPLEKELQKYVHEHHLGKIVHFEGYVPEAEKPNYLASADIAVFPSLGGESFGIVLIEAMAASPGVVLAGNNAGYRHVLGSHKEQLFKASDIDAFAKILRQYIRSPRLRERARKWQQEAVHRYDVQNVGREMIDVYSKAIAKRLRKGNN